MPRNKTSVKSKVKKRQNKKARQQKGRKMNHQNISALTQTARPLLDKKALFAKYMTFISVPKATFLNPHQQNTPKSIHIHKFSLMNLGGGTQLLSNTKLDIKAPFIKEGKTYGSIYGLIGKNGIGKTTLLNAMYNYEIEGFPNHIRMLLVQQNESNNQNKNILQCVLESDVLRQQLQETECKFQAILDQIIGDSHNSHKSTSVLLDRINYLLDIFDRSVSVPTECTDYKQREIEAILDIIGELKMDFNFDNSEIRARKILTGLGFSNACINEQKVCDLSGGWQTRLKLASALFIEPDLMLLDEPTNHLDFPTVLWLQYYLQKYAKTVIIVSHDRSFMNAVCTQIMFLDKQRLQYYPGNYENMSKCRNIENAQLMRHLKDYKKEFAELRKSIAIYNKKWSRVAEKQQKSQITQKRKRYQFLKLEIDKLERLTKKDKPLTFSFQNKKLKNNVKLEKYVVQMQNVCFKYADMDRLLLRNINLTLTTDSRIGMIGPNGVGKTTLLQLITGQLCPLSGFCEQNRCARLSFFTQLHTQQLNLKQNAIDYIYDKFKNDDCQLRVSDIRRKLGQFNLTGKQHTTIMQNLSGGEKSRVAFCIACWREPHFLIMDEPTNHLDIESIEALIEAINAFEGGCLVISHDQYFLSKIGKEFWSVTSNGIEAFERFCEAKKFALKQRMLKLDFFG